jgi:hypothetical protein
MLHGYKLYIKFDVFTAVTVKNDVLWMLRRVALVRTDVWEERSASIIRVTRIGELGTTVAVFLASVLQLLVTANAFLARQSLSP